MPRSKQEKLEAEVVPEGFEPPTTGEPVVGEDAALSEYEEAAEKAEEQATGEGDEAPSESRSNVLLVTDGAGQLIRAEPLDTGGRIVGVKTP